MRRVVGEGQKSCNGCEEERVKKLYLQQEESEAKSSKGKQHKEEGSRISVLI